MDGSNYLKICVLQIGGRNFPSLNLTRDYHVECTKNLLKLTKKKKTKEKVIVHAQMM